VNASNSSRREAFLSTNDATGESSVRAYLECAKRHQECELALQTDRATEAAELRAADITALNHHSPTRSNVSFLNEAAPVTTRRC